MTTTLSVDVWSDIACPWCYIGKRHLEAALAKFTEAERAAVTWRAFQLDPAAPSVPSDVPYVERLARKYGTTATGAQQMIDRMAGIAAEDGIEMDFTQIRPSNTFDAHRMLRAARAQGLQTALKERLFRAYLCEGQVMADHDTLAGLAREVGMDADTVEAVLHTDEHAEAVQRDRQEAAAMAVDGVPFFVIGGRYAVAGAQPAELLLTALERAAGEIAAEADEPAGEAPGGDGPTCGPDDCA